MKSYPSQVKKSWAWWHMYGIPTLGRLRQEDWCEPPKSLRPYLKKKKSDSLGTPLDTSFHSPYPYYNDVLDFPCQE